MIVVLNLHTKPEPEWLQSGAGRPLLGRPALDCGHLATAFAWTSLIASWSRCSLRCPKADKSRLVGLEEAGRPPSGSSQPSVAPMLLVDACDLPGRWIANLDMSLH